MVVMNADVIDPWTIRGRKTVLGIDRFGREDVVSLCSELFVFLLSAFG